MPDWKFGQVVKWVDPPPEGDPEPLGRFMVVTKDQPIAGWAYTTVVCVVAAPYTDWHVGEIVPCRSAEFELAE